MTAVPTLDAGVRATLAALPVSAITTILTTCGLPRMFMKAVARVAPTTPKLIGQAFTLRYIPSRPDLDNIEAASSADSLQRLALESCPQDYVLVIDARGDTSIACAGDTFIGRLRSRGCAGIVTDGGLRDVDAVTALEFPTFLAAPASPPTFIGHHAADMNVPIGCGGVPVYPGDVLVGDGDGVVVIPIHLAGIVAEKGRDIVEYDAFVDEQLATGRSLIGLYPASPASREEFVIWKREREAAERDLA